MTSDNFFYYPGVNNHVKFEGRDIKKTNHYDCQASYNFSPFKNIFQVTAQKTL